MFGSEHSEIVCAYIDHDPGATDVLPLFVATQDCEVRSARAIIVNNVNQTDAAYFTLALYNGGTAGTSTTALSGTIGGTAGTPGWTALKPETLAMVDGTVSSGEVVTLLYTEASTATFGAMLIELEIVDGVGADA